jgi:hypothetical protein
MDTIVTAWKLITAMLLLLLPVAQLFRDWKFSDRRTKRHHVWTKVILFGFLAASISSIGLTWIESRRADQFEQTITSNFEEAHRWRTGGDNWPVFDGNTPFAEQDIAEIFIQNTGPLPLSEVHVRVQNINQNSAVFMDWEAKNPKPPPGVLVDVHFSHTNRTRADGETFDFGTINPGEFKSLTTLNLAAQPGRFGLAKCILWIRTTTPTASGQQWMEWIMTNGIWTHRSTISFAIKSGTNAGFFDLRTSAKNYPAKASWDLPVGPSGLPGRAY